MSASEYSDRITVRLKRQPDILVDGGECYIADMTVVTPDTLIVSNITNKCVQLLDSRNGRVLSQIQLQNEPGRLCLTDRTTAAVTMRDKIQMIKVKDRSLTKGKKLTVRENVYGITFSKNSLVVSYGKPPWLQVISMKGKVLQQFDQPGKSKLFMFPWFMCTTPDGSVFISDCDTDTITDVQR